MTAEPTPEILIVDDLPDNLRLLEGVLSGAGYRVRPATNGELALRAAARRPPDLVLLDINMPAMDGFEVCRRFKADGDLAGIPIIFISALDDTTDKVRALEAGGVDYVSKPFEAKEVLARVRAHCDLRQAQLQLEAKNHQLETTLAELKRTQVQLVQQEKMASLGVMAAGLAHELNNPINFVSSGINGLQEVQGDLLRLLEAHERGADPQEIADLHDDIDWAGTREALTELTASIATGAHRCAGIVEGMRMYAHPGQQEMKLLPVQDCIESALMLVQNRLRQGAQVETRFAPVPMTLFHPGPVNQVFVNLLGNALDAMEEQRDPTPIITITTEARSVAGRAGIACTVADNGPGMPATVIDHVFEPFYTTKEVGRGVGLGLSISHGIIAEHDGQLTCTNLPDGGCAFTVWIPLPDEQTLQGAP